MENNAMNAASEQAQTLPSTSPDEVITEISPTENASNGEAEAAGGGNVDKIREIIFGGQMRDYEKRFKLLETRLIQESAELREDTRQRLEILESFVKRELDALSDRLLGEQRAREDATQGTLRALNDAGQAFEAKHAQLETNHAKSQRDLREQILDHAKSLRDEIRQRHEDMSSALGREVAGLDDHKASRSDLASLFSELAVRLNGDLTTQDS
jgi:hypothetical protein